MLAAAAAVHAAENTDDANAIEVNAIGIALVACTRVSAAGERDRRRGQRRIRSRPARGHRRSVQSGIAGESSNRRHRWRRALWHRRSATRRVCRHLYADRLQHDQAGRHRAGRWVHRHRERRNEGRRARRDDHGHRRQPAGRYTEHQAAAGGLARGAQCLADQHGDPLEHRGNHPWHGGTGQRRRLRRRVLDVQRAQRDLSRQGRRDDRLRRDADHRHGLRLVHRTAHQPGHGRPMDGRDRRRAGGERCRRRPPERRPEERRQFAQRELFRQLQQQQPAERQYERRSARTRSDDGERTEIPPLRRRICGRADQAG